MAVDTINFTTGPATLPSVGQLRYNGCYFSPLYETNVSGAIVKDNAGRTTKFMEYTLTADGYVTLPTGATDIAPTMLNLRRLLTAQGGSLIYQGRGCDIVVNAETSGVSSGATDLAWGPVPELLDFQPLGGGLSAKIKWACKVRIPELQATQREGMAGVVGLQAGNIVRLLQFNYESTVTYGEDGYTTVSVKGTLEIPLTRLPFQTTRTVPRTADDLREEVERRVMKSIDLKRFRVSHRDFSTSRDKRTLEWSFTIEEVPRMDLPMFCTVARGNFSVKPAKTGMGLCLWLCSLNVSYTVRADVSREAAYLQFMAMLYLRMRESSIGNFPELTAQDQKLNPPKGKPTFLTRQVGTTALPLIISIQRQLATAGVLANSLFGGDEIKQPDPKNQQGGAFAGNTRNAFLIDFGFDEGLYLDAKTMSFHATWRLVTYFSHILLASGLWTKLPRVGADKKNLWEASIRDISGHQSWNRNRLDPSLDIIVDFGS